MSDKLQKEVSFENNRDNKKKKADSMEPAFVPGTGFEPARPFEHHHLKVACLPISTPGLGGSKCN